VKILDFGLAKLVQRPALADYSTGALARQDDATPSGTVLGTLGYMSPEQVRGKPADSRSDLFALGSLLYEMLSGQRAFREPTAADTMTAILTKEPPEITTAGGPIPPLLEVIVRRCLEKDPKARFQCVRDLAFALDKLSDMSTGRHAAALPAASASRFRLALLLLATAAFAVTATRLLWPPPPAGGAALSLTHLTTDAGLTTNPSLSRDGKLLAYASDRAGNAGLDIWVRQMAGGEALRLTRDAADDHQPSLSHDGTRIVFRSERHGGGIYLVPALGGNERLILNNGYWPRFSPDGTRIACLLGGSGSGSGSAAIAPSTGGTPREFTSLTNVSMLIWSPDGKHLLLVGNAYASTTFDWWVVPAEPAPDMTPVRVGAREVLERHGLATTTALGNPDPFPKPSDWVGNRILFSATRGHGANVWEVDIDPKSFQISGAPRRMTMGTEIEAQPIEGAGGRLVFSAQRSSVDLWELTLDEVTQSPRGEMRRLTQDQAVEELPTIAEGGEKIAFISGRLGNPDVWTKDLRTGKEMALTATPEDETQPVISPDGTHAVYAFLPRADKPVVYSVSTSGGVPEKVCEGCGAPTDLSRDGRVVILQYLPDWFEPRRERPTLAMLDRQSGKQAEILKHPRYNLYRGHLSPDERWIVFHGDLPAVETREFIAPFRGASAVPPEEWVQVTDGTSFNDTPQWSPDGNLIYYFAQRDGSRCLWAQRLHPATKQPAGPPFAVKHLHERQRSAGGVSLASLDLAVSRDKIVFNMTELWANIWSADFTPQ
jgi:Tol biopolymer transport system component